jgi:hypothetical protein
MARLYARDAALANCVTALRDAYDAGAYQDVRALARALLQRGRPSASPGARLLHALAVIDQ